MYRVCSIETRCILLYAIYINSNIKASVAYRGICGVTTSGINVAKMWQQYNGNIVYLAMSHGVEKSISISMARDGGRRRRVMIWRRK